MIEWRAAQAALFLFVASIPLDAVAIDGIGSLSVVTGIALVPVALVAILKHGRVRRLSLAHYAVLCFGVWAAFSYVWAIDSDANFQRVLTYAQLIVFVMLFWQIARTREDALGVMLAYVLGSSIAMAGVFLNAYTGNTTEGALRFAAMGFNENDLGVTLVLGIPMAWFLAQHVNGIRSIAAYAYVPAALVAMLLTGSRGSTIASLAALTIIPAKASQSKRYWLILVFVAGISAVALAYLVPSALWERMLTIQDEVTSGTMTHRTEIWSAGWDVFKENWVVGVGAGAFQTAVEGILNWRIVAHNAFLSVAVELGSIGLLLFITAPVLTAVRARRSPTDVRHFVWVLLLTWVVGVSSLSWEYRKPTWFVFALALMLVSPGYVVTRCPSVRRALPAEGVGAVR